MQLNEYIKLKQFSIDKIEKQKLLSGFLNELHQHHFKYSEAYRKISTGVFNKDDKQPISAIEHLPFLPVSIFKNHYLKSIPDADVFKTLTSSGTTGTVPSRIVLDKETAQLQTLALSKIITAVTGNERLPMLIVDSQALLKNRTSFSARGAGILGMSVFGKNHQYILDDNYELDAEKMTEFLRQFNGQKMLIFGFTFMVWQYLFLQDKVNDIDLSNAILIHSGGWKKLQERAVDNQTFKQKLQERFGLKQIYNFYGMVEQVGSVFLENAEGYLHCPNFSDVIIRNPYDLSVQPHGKEGLIQVVSALPRSYPGHSLLTEDIGVCVGEDNSASGWKGKYFKISGRAKKAELRGCSDTFAQSKTV
jgi:phenylacetate-coenzyme A ligase PaaK-like adenylate-forming protein